jgi:hypothetical protein
MALADTLLMRCMRCVILLIQVDAGYILIEHHAAAPNGLEHHLIRYAYSSRLIVVSSTCALIQLSSMCTRASIPLTQTMHTCIHIVRVLCANVLFSVLSLCMLLLHVLPASMSNVTC